MHRGLVKYVSFFSLYFFKEKHFNVSFSKTLCAHCSCDRLSKLPESSCGWNPGSLTSHRALNPCPHVPTSPRSGSPTETQAEGAASLPSTHSARAIRHKTHCCSGTLEVCRRAPARWWVSPLHRTPRCRPCCQGLSVWGVPRWLPRSVLCSHGSCTRRHTRPSWG